MNLLSVASRFGFKLRARWIVLGLLLMFFGTGMAKVGSAFFLSAPSATLRQAVMSSSDSAWKKRFAFRVGWMTTGLVRMVSHHVQVPPEGRAILEAVHAGDLGVYELDSQADWKDRGAMFAATDLKMKAKRWVRVVGVCKGGDAVAIYMPRKGTSISDVRCCVMVLKDRQLIIASAEGNLEPMWQLAHQFQDRLPAGAAQL
jgi:hypothetical protein